MHILKRPLAARVDLEPDHLAIAQLEDVRALLMDLDSAPPAAADVAGQHDHVVADLEELIGLGAPLLPLAQPGA